MTRRSILLICLAVALHAGVSNAEPNPSELIVLLPPSADPPSVVHLIEQGGTALPYGLETGSPLHARLFLPARPIGRTLQWILTHPSAPFAMLHRYIVIEYPVPTDVFAVQSSLQTGGQLASVEPNLAFKLASSTAVVPNDPFFGTLLGDPNFSQWGLHLMGFPAAWEWAKGHAQIGIVDKGIEKAHRELYAYLETDPINHPGVLTWQGGSFREHRSFNVGYVSANNPAPNSSCDVDELEDGDLYAGHGTHVAGLVSARTNNGSGVAGSCWSCSLQIAKAFEDDQPDRILIDTAASAASTLVTEGAQILNFSFGMDPAGYGACSPSSSKLMCVLLRLISERQVVVSASAGNNLEVVAFPASDPGVIAVGGVQRASAPPYFERWIENPCTVPGQCGSNFGSGLDLVAPAKNVLSTLYTGWNHNPDIRCGDKPGLPTMPGIPGDGFGTCTGTSMAAPLVSGLAGILRSVSPLLSDDEVVDVLTSTASLAAAPDEFLSHGIPQAEAAVLRAIGKTNSRPIANRLTPLFSMASFINGVHFYTPFPQEASALTFDNRDPFDSTGPDVAGYNLPGACSVSPCPANPASASFYLFTSDRIPFGSASALQPFYRLRYDPARDAFCRTGASQPLSDRRFAYALSTSEINRFKNEIVDGSGLGYDVDGILGWIHPWCEPNATCRPPGTTALYRLYNSDKDDWALVVESERGFYEDLGYSSVPQIFAGVGFVYPNADSDGDLLVDGWERLLGTGAGVVDTDCDGLSDGFEVRSYRSTGPVENHGYRDPLDGPCFPFFGDGFETGNTGRWHQATGPDDGINF